MELPAIRKKRKLPKNKSCVSVWKRLRPWDPSGESIRNGGCHAFEIIYAEERGERTSNVKDTY